MTLSSPFLEARVKYKPRFPEALKTPQSLQIQSQGTPSFVANDQQQDQLKNLFPHTYHQQLLKLTTGSDAMESRPLTVACVLSGGQAPGGHNVICGLFDALLALNPDSKLIGFKAGPGGILKDHSIELQHDYVDTFRNTGGFDMLGSGRTKIETKEQFERCKEVLESHRIDALVVIGGDDSNTNAALLAEFFKESGSKVQVVGVPKTIDGDLKNSCVETSFGFDTAVRVYSELIANLSRDTLSAKKYYHFIRLMGRSASHITMEAAFQTQPNLALLGEEIARSKTTLKGVVEEIAQVVIERAELGLNYGIILVPEGVVEFIPEVRELIGELNQIIGDHKTHFDSLSGFSSKSEWINGKLGRDASYTFSSMPIDIQRQFLMDRDPHGNVQVSLIETEKLLIEMLNVYFAEAKSEGKFKGKFKTQRHFLGYEGRCAAPTNFDADYAYALGRTAIGLLAAGTTGYMAVIKNLAQPRETWEPLGVPLVSMMNLESRNGKEKPVIRKGLVDLDGLAFKHFSKIRTQWRTTNPYRFAGPIQYFGDPQLCDRVPFSLALEQGVDGDCCW
jgi:pyrophosphate--fructose-6-phosphate 1-phosphotransferase